MSNQSNRTDELRLKRSKILESREQARLRNLHGPGLVDAIVIGIKRPVILDDFDINFDEPLHFDWPKDLAAASGLVAAYIDKKDAAMLLACFQEKLGPISGIIGFHEKNYMGFAMLQDVSPSSLLAVSETAEDSVLFYVDQPKGAIMVDYYPSQAGNPFSVVVQGNNLVRELSSCFIPKKNPTNSVC